MINDPDSTGFKVSYTENEIDYNTLYELKGIQTTSDYFYFINSASNELMPIFIGEPKEEFHAATKNYVDSQISGSGNNNTFIITENMVSRITTYGSKYGDANYLFISMNAEAIASSRLEAIAKIISSHSIVLPISINEYTGLSAVNSNYRIVSSTSASPGLNISFYLPDLDKTLQSGLFGGDNQTIYIGEFDNSSYNNAVWKSFSSGKQFTVGKGDSFIECDSKLPYIIQCYL